LTVAEALPPSAVVGVVGCGAMGSGIAEVAAAAGHPVLLCDLSQGAAAAAVTAIASSLARRVHKGGMSAADRNALLARLTPVPAPAALADAALVIEAVVEDLEAKRRLFAEIEAAVRERAILATNTSSLSITAIAAGLGNPSRAVGMHFFNPPTRMPLVEVVPGLATDPEVADTVFATAAAWGKQPVRARSTPGFIVNRIARPFYGEALRLLEEGAADPATIDAIARECGGFPMGPFQLMDLIGNDVNYAVTESIFRAFHGDPRFTPSVRQKELVDAGWLGRKSGRGFYRYGDDVAGPPPDEAPPAAARVERVRARGDLGPAAALLPLLARQGIAVAREENAAAAGIDLPGCRLALTDGRSATRRGADEGRRDLVLFDLCLDFPGAGRVALARSARCPDAALAEAAGLFRRLGKRVSVIADVPGLLVMRTVAMLVSFAADAVHAGVATPEDIDTAMERGVNYPRGPVAWCRALGARRVVAVLEAIQQAYGEDRYRASPLLRQMVAAGSEVMARL
jgi:3-hydroxybutyryl-CoA dehydrogenase